MIQKLKNNIEFLGLNFKKELRNFIIINVVIVLIGIAAYLITKSIVYLAFSIPFILTFSLFYISRYGSKINQQNQKNVEEFTVLFSYFKIYLHNNYSVYTTLKELQNYASESLKKLLQELVEKIDEDKSVKPFIEFSSHFNDTIIEEMMISIYQMIDDGASGDNLMHYDLIFDKFSDLMHQKSLKKKDSKLGTLSSAPLVGSCYLMIVLTVGIVSAIGVMINGI